MYINYLFLVAGLVASGIYVYQERDALDRKLCTKLPWFLRLWWCALWVRADEFHPSLDSDISAVLEKQNFHCRMLKMKMDIFRLKPWDLMTQAECTEEVRRLADLRSKISSEYYLDLARRRAIAHDRDITSPS